MLSRVSFFCVFWVVKGNHGRVLARKMAVVLRVCGGWSREARAEWLVGRLLLC